MTRTPPKGPLRVLLLTYTGGTGGVAVLLRMLLERFKENKQFEFEVCITQELGPVSSEMTTLGVPVHFIGMSGGLDVRKAFRLFQLLRSRKYDIIDFHGIIPLVRLVVALSRPVVSVINEHGAVQGDRARGRGYFKFLHRILDHWTDRYVVVCRPSIDDLVVDHHVRTEKITLIHNGVPLERFRDIPRKRAISESGIVFPPSAVVVGTVRGLIEKMGLDHMIEAARIVADQSSNVVFLVIGDGPLRGALEAQAADAKLDGRFFFLGTRRDIPRILAELDIFVLPSVWEGLPISAIESLAAGVPVVGYAVGGNPEVIIDNETGVLVPRRDPDLLAKGILALVNNEILREELRRKARKYAAAHFDINQTAALFLRLYQESFNAMAQGS